MIPDTISLDISTELKGWSEKLPGADQLMEECLAAMISLVPEGEILKKFPQLEISILLTGDAAIQVLNKEYRARDRPTNVLSFPSLEEAEIKAYLHNSMGLPDYPVALGDIIFSLETLCREAEAQNKSLKDHFCHLFIHGLLHLVAYDHVEEGEAVEMEALEKKILAKLAIDDPYEA